MVWVQQVMLKNQTFYCLLPLKRSEQSTNQVLTYVMPSNLRASIMLLL